MKKLLVDQGGTYVRFAEVVNSAPANIAKYEAADFETFNLALEHYCSEKKIGRIDALLMATAAQPDGNVWRFSSGDSWHVDFEEVTKKNKGIVIPDMLNDLEAMAWSLASPEGIEAQTLFPGKPQEASLCVIAVGTGLGLAYVHYPDGQIFVQSTKGGHNTLATPTQEQFSVMQELQTWKKAQGLPERVVFEDVASGTGLVKLHNAVCRLRGENWEVARAQEVLEAAQACHPAAQETLHLFHQFLGLYIEAEMQSGNGYGGVFLSGGMIDRLEEAELFDLDTVRETYVGGHVPALETAISQVPFHHITDPYPALKGLIVADSCLKLTSPSMTARPKDLKAS